MPRTRKSSKSFGATVNHLDLVSGGVAANVADLAHLGGQNQELDGLLTEARALLSEQKAQTAAKQDLARRIEVLMDRALKLGSFLKVGVRLQYGTRSEKLVEFDMLPFRGRRRTVKPPVPEAAPAD